MCIRDRCGACDRSCVRQNAATRRAAPRSAALCDVCVRRRCELWRRLVSVSSVSLSVCDCVNPGRKLNLTYTNAPSPAAPAAQDCRDANVPRHQGQGVDRIVCSLPGTGSGREPSQRPAKPKREGERGDVQTPNLGIKRRIGGNNAERRRATGPPHCTAHTGGGAPREYTPRGRAATPGPRTGLAWHTAAPPRPRAITVHACQ
eukprot:527380-Prymnesium_polylepis.3